MSSGRPHISEIVDALVLAAGDATISQRFLVAQLPRLAELIAEPNSTAELAARFHWVDGRCGVVGQVSATLRAMCQRCLQPTDLEIDDQFHVVLVKSEADMDDLPDAQDSLIADATQLDLAWLVEEQLLLAMPLVPLHADDACTLVSEPEMESESSEGNEKQMPFAKLRDLMQKPPGKN